MVMLSLPADFLKAQRKIPFRVYDGFSRLLVAAGSTIDDEDRLASLRSRELFVDDKEAGPWRASFTQTAGALIHKEATLEMIAAARLDKSRRSPTPRR